MKQFTQILLLAIAFIFTSCFEKEPKDKIEEVTMYVSHQTDIYYDLFDSGRTHPMEGMIMKEEGWADWECHSFQTIEGFEYRNGGPMKRLIWLLLFFGNILLRYHLYYP